jgi:hypothetical protein
MITAGLRTSQPAPDDDQPAASCVGDRLRLALDLSRIGGHNGHPFPRRLTWLMWRSPLRL